jgi:hypothetical protein
MKFSKQELICFNSILDGKAIVGINLSKEEIQDEDKYIKETIDLLKEKNILDENGKLMQLGTLPIKALGEYKNAKEHVSINMLRIGILDEDKIVVIDTKDDKYDIYMSHKAIIIKEILGKSSFMRSSSTSSDNFVIEKIKDNNLIIKKEDYDKESLSVIKYSNGCHIKEKIYYWDDNEGFEYDFISGTRVQLSPRTMRINLLQDIGLNYL